MLTTPTLARVMFWPASVGVHAVAFIAAGHAIVASAGTQGPSVDRRVIDIAPELATESEEQSPPPDVTRSTTFAPRPTHTHPYPVTPDHDAHQHDPSLVHLPFIAPTHAAEVVAAQPDVVAVSPSPAPARFAMTVTSETGITRYAASGSTARPIADSESGSDSAPMSEEGVSSPARLVGWAPPVYPPEARAQEIEAEVVLAIVVASAGAVADARILKSAGPGFDEAALRAVRAARFAPARCEGRPVAVRMRWTVWFRLR